MPQLTHEIDIKDIDNDLRILGAWLKARETERDTVYTWWDFIEEGRALNIGIAGSPMAAFTVHHFSVGETPFEVVSTSRRRSFVDLMDVIHYLSGVSDILTNDWELQGYLRRTKAGV